MKNQEELNVFSPADLQYIQTSGRSLPQILEQLARFKDGFPPPTLIRPVSRGDGIMNLGDSEEKQTYIQVYEERAAQVKVCKFVPASGAASRMFRMLYAFMTNPEDLTETVKEFFQHLPQFAFFDALKGVLGQDNLQIESLLTSQQFDLILTYLLTEKGLNHTFTTFPSDI